MWPWTFGVRLKSAAFDEMGALIVQDDVLRQIKGKVDK